MADRLDTLVSIFGLGMMPTGSSDPFALRRAANAIVSITWYADLDINLNRVDSTRCNRLLLLLIVNLESPVTSVQEFFIQRIRTLLQDEKEIDYDLVNAVIR